jgi:GDP-L-fucose synthase
VNILVTGATGFLGAALCARLEADGHSVTRLGSREADLRQSGSLEFYSRERYDEVFHLAAWTQAGDFALYHPGEQWIINQQINTNVLAWWQARQPQARLISIGTSCAYDPKLELVEANYLEGRPIENLFTYALSKRMLYAGLLALEKQFGLRHLTLVPSTLYGPGYHTDGRQMHFIFDLIRKILRGRLYGEPVVLWGDGYQRRELIYLGDFLDLMLLVRARAENDLVNVGAGEEHPIRHFAQLICEHVGYDFDRIQFDTSRYVGARSKCLVIDKLRRLAPEFKLTPLTQGLATTIDWVREQREVLLKPND